MNLFRKLFGSGSKESLKKLYSQCSLLEDVRSRDEYNIGHAADSVNIPVQFLIQAKEKLKDKTVIAVCRTGTRSAMAVNLLTNEGIKAYNGGAWDNWKKA